jgi:hypothetical protein
LSNYEPFWKTLFEREMKKLNIEKISLKHQKFIQNLSTCLSKKGKKFDKWKSVFKGFMTKKMIFSLEKKVSIENLCRKAINNSFFWEEILKDLNHFEDLTFTRKMDNNCNSLLDLFFISFFPVFYQDDFDNFPKKTRSYNTQVMIKLFQKIIDKTKLKIDKLSAKNASPLHYLIWMNDFEFLKYVLSTCNVKKTFPYQIVASQRKLDLKIVSLLVEYFGERKFTEKETLNIIQKSNLDFYFNENNKFKHPEYLCKIRIGDWVLQSFTQKNKNENPQDIVDELIPRLTFCFENTSIKEAKGLSSQQIETFVSYNKLRIHIIPLIMKFKDNLDGIIDDLFKNSLASVDEMQSYVDFGYEISKTSIPCFFELFKLRNRFNSVLFMDDCLLFLIGNGYKGKEKDLEIELLLDDTASTNLWNSLIFEIKKNLSD